ncbi:MAG: nuclear transport factor 2 family protein [Gammaproteobacteria bacterium]|nr:nuclear transport factor 2 family protein [Gammaproteobacteria bacterium]NNJ72002.1 nuclear transport factor 2 family protein [Enterobacterales bacterium]
MSVIQQANQKFRDMYDVLDKSNLERISEFYGESIRFIDPYHEVNGLAAFEHYFAQMYANVISIEFEFGEATFGERVFHQDWIMTYAHARVNKGKPISFPGCSRVTIDDDGMIIEHQDYFDSGAMLFKQLPVLGSAISYISNRMVS